MDACIARQTAWGLPLQKSHSWWGEMHVLYLLLGATHEMSLEIHFFALREKAFNVNLIYAKFLQNRVTVSLAWRVLTC